MNSSCIAQLGFLSKTNGVPSRYNSFKIFDTNNLISSSNSYTSFKISLSELIIANGVNRGILDVIVLNQITQDNVTELEVNENNKYYNYNVSQNSSFSLYYDSRYKSQMSPLSCYNTSHSISLCFINDGDYYAFPLVSMLNIPTCERYTTHDNDLSHALDIMYGLLYFTQANAILFAEEWINKTLRVEDGDTLLEPEIHQLLITILQNNTLLTNSSICNGLCHAAIAANGYGDTRNYISKDFFQVHVCMYVCL